MPRQSDAPKLPSAPLFRRIAIEVLEQAMVQDGRNPSEAGVALCYFLEPSFYPTADADYVERVLREALRG